MEIIKRLKQWISPVGKNGKCKRGRHKFGDPYTKQHLIGTGTYIFDAEIKKKVWWWYDKCKRCGKERDLF